MKEYRILITGSRYWDKYGALSKAIGEEVIAEAERRDTIDPIDWVTIVHGDAPGADTDADTFARAMNWKVEKHPADWNKHGKAAGPIRNQEMVDAGADVVIAFVHPTSKGTLHCMRQAKKAGIRVVQVNYDEVEED